MDDQTTLWLSISMPLMCLSLLVTFLLMKKFQPVPKRKFLISTALAIAIIGTTIGFVFINDILAVVFLSLTLPALSMFIWFLTQPFIKDGAARREKSKIAYDEYIKNKRKGRK